MVTVVLPAAPVGPLFGLKLVITGVAETVQILTNTQLNATIFFNIIFLIKNYLNYVMAVSRLQYAFVIINLKWYNSSSRLFAQESKLCFQLGGSKVFIYNFSIGSDQYILRYAFNFI